MSKFIESYRTSRGVPARLRILTTAWIPLASSNARIAADESTKIHKSVSRTTDVRGGDGEADFEFEDELVLTERCREASNRSSSIWRRDLI